MLRKLALLTFAARSRHSAPGRLIQPAEVAACPRSGLPDATEGNGYRRVGRRMSGRERRRVDAVDVQWLRDRFGEPEYKLSNKRPCGRCEWTRSRTLFTSASRRWLDYVMAIRRDHARTGTRCDPHSIRARWRWADRFNLQHEGEPMAETTKGG